MPAGPVTKHIKVPAGGGFTSAQNARIVQLMSDITVYWL